MLMQTLMKKKHYNSWIKPIFEFIQELGIYFLPTKNYCTQVMPLTKVWQTGRSLCISQLTAVLG